MTTDHPLTAAEQVVARMDTYTQGQHRDSLIHARARNQARRNAARGGRSEAVARTLRGMTLPPGYNREVLQEAAHLLESDAGARRNILAAVDQMLKALDEGRYRTKDVHIRADLSYIRSEAAR